MQTNDLVEIYDLHRHFVVGGQTVRALDGLDLTIAEGEFLAILGPSGSGKSTLLYLLGGLDQPTSGQLWVAGQALNEMHQDRLAAYRGEQVGFIFQSFCLVPSMTAMQNVELPMILRGMLPEKRRARASALLDRVGLGDRTAHKPTELSGGQQQRVAIARALANDPAIILADEPTGNLDSHTGTEIMNLLCALNRAEHRTIVIVSHDPLVTNYATTAIHLQDGRLCQQKASRAAYSIPMLKEAQ